ncbi:MAG: hypothetical protein V1492_02785 [Candidatus Micrarchaeota archaeon]
MDAKNDGSPYEHLNGEWKKTTRVLLGRELGELKDYEKWLLELKQPRLKCDSAVSGREVVFASGDYATHARSVGLDEVSEKFEPLGINQIKDVDSIIEALRERMHYCGNIVLGNSKYVEKSSSVSNSFYVYESARIYDSKNIACSTIAKTCQNLFGCNVGSFADYVIRCHQYGKGSRNFESCLCWMSSDCHYTYNVVGCNDCLFSFNLKAKRYAIGNLVLPREKYLAIKKNILEELADILEEKKRAPMLVEIINNCGTPSSGQLASLSAFAMPSTEKGEMRQIEVAFAKTSKLVLGKELSGVDNYAPWLKRHIIDVDETESVLGSGKIPVPAYANFQALRKDRYVNIVEADAISDRLKLAEEDAARIDFSNASEILSRIAFLSSQFQTGEIANVFKAPIIISSTNCYSILGCVNLKDSAFSTWPNGSDHVFGSAFVFNSAFCLNSYQSFNLNNCFEVDTSSNSARCYFSHNIENVHDSMFCFNAKNLSYAVGNTPLGRETYLKAKDMLQSWLLEKLEKKKDVGTDIFNLLGTDANYKP